VIAAPSAALVCSIALIAWAVAMRALSGTWLQPSAFFALWWCFAGIAPLILMPNDPVGVNAMAWLVAASIAFSLGALVGNWGFKTRRLAEPPATTDRELAAFSAVCFGAVMLGLGSNVAFVLGTPGISFSDGFSIENLVLASNLGYLARFGDVGVAAPPRLSQALLPFVYLAPAAGAIVFALGRRPRYKILGLVSFLPAIAVTILQTAKAATLIAMTLWFSCYFATRLRQGKLAVFTRAHLIAALVIGTIVTTFFFAVGLARLATTDVTLLNVVLVKIATSAFGHMTVFSHWLSEYMSSGVSPTLGAVTFAGPLELLGFGHRAPGLFENFVDLAIGETSNVFTGFRPLIQDFTVAGALVALALVGAVGGAGFRLVAAGKWSAVPLLLIAYVTIFWTPVTWFWIYNSLTATVVAIALIVLFVRVWRGRHHAATA
jgi:oligosaccharide repeat unit polymerase